MGHRSSGGPSINPESAFRAHPESNSTEPLYVYKIYCIHSAPHSEVESNGGILPAVTSAARISQDEREPVV